MSWFQIIDQTTSWLLGGLLILIFVYMLARAIGVAWFKTKREHFRMVLRDLENRNTGKDD